MNTIIEPFRINSVEPIYFCTKEERRIISEKAFYNPFLINSKADKSVPEITKVFFSYAHLYVAGGTRSVNIGSPMFRKYDAKGKLIPAQMALVLLAIPQREYIQSQLGYEAEMAIGVSQKSASISKQNDSERSHNVTPLPGKTATDNKLIITNNSIPTYGHISN